MRRSLPFVLCFCFCALASGMTLMALAQDVSRPSISRTTETAPANVDLVRRFYSAVAAVLATGETALFDPYVAYDLVEHPAQPGAISGREGFVRALLAVRVTFPGLRLIVDDVRVAGRDQVVARVHTEGAEQGNFLGRPVPASLGQWGPVEVWRIAGGQLVERWGDRGPSMLLPLGQAPISIDALGPGRQRVTVTRMTMEPGATLSVNNGQAIRVFAIDSGTLTVSLERHFGGSVAVTRRSAMPAVSEPGTSIATAPGDRVVTAAEANYTLSNAGPKPSIVLVVVVSNTLVREWPLVGTSAAASWSVAAIPESLGGALPSPSGISADVLSAGIEIELPEQTILALGWMFLTPGATLVLPAGTGTAVAMVVEGWVDMATIDGLPTARFASVERLVISDGVGSLWQARDNAPAVVLLLSMCRDEAMQ